MQNIIVTAELVTVENGFVPTKALDITRSFMKGGDFIAKHGPTVVSLEGPQTVTPEAVVMFDDVANLLGYPASQKAFAKYEVLSMDETTGIGTGIKRDNTEYLSKKMEQPFEVKIWNGDIVVGQPGDYLVACPANNDFRIVAADVYPASYSQL